MANQYEDQNNNQQERSPNTNKGNFKNDPQRASEAGRKGGEASRGRRSQ